MTRTEDRAASAALLRLLEQAVAAGASDLHLRPEAPALLRIHGQLTAATAEPLTPEQTEALVDAALGSERDRATFAEHGECDFALTGPGIGRFRGNAYRSRGNSCVVLRHVRESVPSPAELGLPEVVSSLAASPAGLVIIAGPTGSGKTTTLASMVDLINATRRCHILTIEDPIEFLHRDRLSTVSQREVHTDTESFGAALRAGLRQDPDVILVGEIRDIETLRTAMQAAETGHLVLASLHAKSAVDAVHRLVDLYPQAEQRQARLSLSESLRGIVCQRLALPLHGDVRIPVVEVLVGNGRVRDAIADADKTVLLSEIIAEGEYYGMRSMEQDLVRLVLAGDLSVDEAESIIGASSDLHVALKRAGYHSSARSIDSRSSSLQSAVHAS